MYTHTLGTRLGIRASPSFHISTKLPCSTLSANFVKYTFCVRASARRHRGILHPLPGWTRMRRILLDIEIHIYIYIYISIQSTGKAPILWKVPPTSENTLEDTTEIQRRQGAAASAICRDGVLRKWHAPGARALRDQAFLLLLFRFYFYYFFLY